MTAVNRCIFTPANAGTVDFVVSGAVTGYLTPAQAGAVDGATYSYSAETRSGSGAITAWEVGSGVYDSGTTTLSRVPVFSSNGNSLTDFGSVPNVMITSLDLITATANITWYVSSTGDDANDGLTVGTAFATLQKGVDVWAAYDWGDDAFRPLTLVQPGTYTEPAMLEFPDINAIGIIQGSDATPSTVVLDNFHGVRCFKSDRSNALTFESCIVGFRILGADGATLLSSYGGTLIYNNLEIGCSSTGTTAPSIIFNSVGEKAIVDIGSAAPKLIRILSGRWNTSGGTATGLTYMVNCDGGGEFDINIATVTFDAPVTWNTFLFLSDSGAFLSTMTWNSFVDFTGNKAVLRGRSGLITDNGAFTDIPGTTGTFALGALSYVKDKTFGDVNNIGFVGHQSIGQNASESPLIAVNVDDALTGDFSGDFVAGQFVRMVLDNTNATAVDSANGIFGTVSTAPAGTGDFTGLAGVAFEAVADGSGDTTTIYGGYLVGTNNGSGATDTIYGLYTQGALTGAGNVTNIYGVFVKAASDTGGGAITNNYGMYLEDQSGKASTINYNIGSKGSASRNLFEGTTELGAHTFAQLPSSPVAGMMAYVTNSDTLVWGATIATSGASNGKVLAFYNGSVWTVAGK